MRSHAAAFGWELGRRHRWGLGAVAAYISILAVIRLLFLGRERVNFADDWAFAFVVIVPMATTFMYFLAVFTFGLAGDIAGRESMYPSRRLTLPVTSASLAGWPMVYGMSAMSLLWLATRALAIWPKDVHVPLLWPAVLAAVVLGWAQALTWMPYPLRGLRVVVTVVILVMIDVVAIPGLHFRIPDRVMIAILAPQIPLTYLVAWFAVGRARRGEIPDWRKPFDPILRAADHVGTRRGAFRTPGHAQTWLEWRRHGRSLPILVTILLPFEIGMILLFRETPVIVVETLVAILLTPPLMATFVAATVGKSNPDGSDVYNLPSFVAVRPLRGTAIAGAKLRATLSSTVVTWVIVGVSIPVALYWTGTTAVVADLMRDLIGITGPRRAIVIVLLVLLLLVLTTWKQLVQSLYIGMSGRPWLVKGSLFGTLVVMTLLIAAIVRVSGSRAMIAAIWNTLPWILALLVCLKIGLACWVVARLHVSSLLGDRGLVGVAASWSVVVLTLYAVLNWIIPMELIGGYFLGMMAILLVPLVRVSAIPLALAWNRHR